MLVPEAKDSPEASAITLLLSLMLAYVFQAERIWSAGIEAPSEPFECPC
jgi:hypothetical protein